MTHTEPITFREGKDSLLGGVDITISLTPAQARALGSEASNLADWFHTALSTTARLRTGRDADGNLSIAGPNTWYIAINDIGVRLIPRLEGIRDAATRAHAATGGTVQSLAYAMDVGRSTAQYRRETLLKAKPSTWERWAEHGGPQLHCQACGHLASPTDPLVTTADQDAYLIHRSHVITPGDGFFGTPTDSGVTPYTIGTPVAGGFVIGQLVRITGVSGPLADRTDLIGKVGEIVAEARDGSLNLRGLTSKPRSEEVFADLLGFQATELEAAPTAPHAH